MLLRLVSGVLSALVITGVGAAMLHAQRDAAPATQAETRAALLRAQEQAKIAGQRGKQMEAEAGKATAAAEKTAREAAALAARIQQSEARIDISKARIALIQEQRATLKQRMAARREPLVRLTAGLQKMARRPLALSAFRPGTLQDAVYTRALLESTLPEVEKRTADLRDEIARGQKLEQETQRNVAAISGARQTLMTRRKALTAIESRLRLESRQASGEADREAERALALAEETRDLNQLMTRLDVAGALREELAALPGPVLRPATPANSETAPSAPRAVATASARPPSDFQLPVMGRTLTGFGAIEAGGQNSKSLALAPRAGAQVVAPASGRVVFAGRYSGYGRIVIIEHASGWTSLVTGLGRIDTQVGRQVVGGSPLGVAEIDRPVVRLELRRDGAPVNPLDYV
ncbi:MAG: murein hydrolase activator EnvC family protein [Sphingomonadaceae bacterium]